MCYRSQTIVDSDTEASKLRLTFGSKRIIKLRVTVCPLLEK